MTKRLKLLSSLAALVSCLPVRLVVGSDENAGFLRGKYLHQLAQNLRRLDGLEECPGTIISMYYDANVTVMGRDEYEEECGEDDMVYVGIEIEKIIKELEEEYPRYSNEFLDTKFCAVPSEVEEVVTATNNGNGVQKVGDTVDKSPGNPANKGEEPTDSPTVSPTASPTGSPTASPTASPTEKKSGGANLTVKTQSDGLPPWLMGGNRYLQKKVVPTPTMEVLPEPTMAPALVPVIDRRLANPTRKPTRRPTAKPTAKPTPKKKKKKRRKKKRYTFKSSGNCRTCKTDNKDKRRRRVEEVDKDAAEDLAKETCNLASTATFAADVAKKGVKNCQAILDEVSTLSDQYNDKTLGDQFVADADFLLSGCKEQELEARRAAKGPPEWCSLANAASKESEMYAKTQEYRDSASQDSGEAVVFAKNVHNLNQEMMGVKINLKKKILAQNFDIQRRELENLLDAERANNDLLEEEMDDQIALAEEQLSLAQDDLSVTELEERKATLEQMKVEREEQLQKMEVEIGRMRDEYEKQLEFQIKEANILLEMEGAESVNEWLQEFAVLMAHRIPPLLLERFDCFLEEPEVTATIIEKDSEATTYQEQCILPWDA